MTEITIKHRYDRRTFTISRKEIDRLNQILGFYHQNMAEIPDFEKLNVRAVGEAQYVDHMISVNQLRF